jgi:hypothetical protein
MSTHTTQQVGAAADCGQPEFIDAKGLQRLFSISRSHAYALIAEGKLRSACLRKPGRLRGKRLFDVAAVRAFLNSCVDEGGNTQGGQK